MPLKQQAEKGVTMLGDVIDQDYHGEIGLFLHNGSKNACVWSVGDLLGYLLVQLCFV